LIDPEILVPTEIQQLTGLTNELLSLFPSVSEIRADFIRLHSGSTLVSYGDFENRWLPPNGLATKCFSALSAVRERVRKDRVVAPMPDFKLETVASRLNIPHQPHDSLSDVTALYNICCTLQVRLP